MIQGRTGLASRNGGGHQGEHGQTDSGNRSAAQCRSGGTQQRQGDADQQRYWPTGYNAYADVLVAGAVIFDRHQGAGRTERAAMDLEVPTVIGAAEGQGAAALLQRVDDGGQA